MLVFHIEAASLVGRRPTAAVRQVAEDLRASLARRDIPAYVYFLEDGQAAVSLRQGLLARVDGRIIWWTSPHPSRRGGTLRTFAFAPATAAARLAEHYATLRARQSPADRSRP
ncbi:hypothetical protein GCM10022226_29040 [Sphaerisporangium flaviroseum]|uniref:Uncharacterized protein n=1 Tax=Sphaerisporangium flaviroseum TaxID=509199 RepID=A0ABP7HY15_9ACTN